MFGLGIMVTTSNKIDGFNLKKLRNVFRKHGRGNPNFTTAASAEGDGS